MMNIHEKYVLTLFNMAKGFQNVVYSDDGVLSYEGNYGYWRTLSSSKNKMAATKIERLYLAGSIEEISIYYDSGEFYYVGKGQSYG